MRNPNPQSDIPFEADIPFEDLTFGNLRIQCYSVAENVFDVYWAVDEGGSTAIHGTLREMDVESYTHFIGLICPPLEPISIEEISRLSPQVISNESRKIDDINPDYVISPSTLRTAFNYAIDSGARLFGSIDKIVKTYQHYLDSGAHQSDTVIDLYSINTESGKISHKLNPKRVKISQRSDGRPENIYWFDVSTAIPHGALNERKIIEIAKAHLPSNLFKEEFEVLSLRGFSIDSSEPGRITRKKLLILVGENSLITLHEGKIDNLGRYGQPDSIQLYKNILSGNIDKSPSELFINTSAQRKLVGPGSLLLDLCKCLFDQQKSVLKRYNQKLDDALYDAQHKIPKNRLFQINTSHAQDAIQYMCRKVKDSSERIDSLLKSRERSKLSKMFGEIPEAESEASKVKLLDVLSNNSDFTHDAESKIERLKVHVETTLEKERELRAYGLTVIGTLFIPLLASVELAQVPLDNIIKNSDKVLIGGGVASIICTVAFVLYDNIRKHRIGVK